MRFVYFTHSIASCWNHGNAHFLRGVLRELLHLGHHVRVLEPKDGWSRSNLLRDHGEGALRAFADDLPELAPYCGFISHDVDAMLDGADVVLVHEWTDPALIRAIGHRRSHGGCFLLLFHDTHHRAVSDPETIRQLDLDGYDAVLAFGEALAEVYRTKLGWGARALVWHEAADTRLFHPPDIETDRAGLVWIGNWGDEERSAELRQYLLEPAADLSLPLDIYGVRYPSAALETIAAHGGCYRGWLPNVRVPQVFARHRMTVHVPRRFYASRLPGIPTIRVFEALACGIPLICAPWSDTEGLFRTGTDYLVARTSTEMREHLRAANADAALRRALADAGLQTIRARHTCAHRARELLGIVARVGGTREMETA